MLEYRHSNGFLVLKKSTRKKKRRLVTFDVAVGDIRVHAEGVRADRKKRREMSRFGSHSGRVVAPDGELLDVVDRAVGLQWENEQARWMCRRDEVRGERGMSCLDGELTEASASAG